MELIAAWDEAPPAAMIFGAVRALAPEGPAFLLDGALPSHPGGCWSFLGFSPSARFRAWGRRVWVDGKLCAVADPLDALDRWLKELGIGEEPPGEGVPPLRAGVVGTVAYDLGRLIEPRAAARPKRSRLPDLDLAAYEAVLAVNERSHRAELWWSRRGGQPPTWALLLVRADLWAMATPSPPAPTYRLAGMSLSPSDYAEAVRTVQKYIAQGDLYQANLTTQLLFEQQRAGDGLGLYWRLRESNPAPFAAYWEADGYAVLSTSPERFLRCDPRSRQIETCPIKGTQPRGETPQEDCARRAALLGSEKDAAELVMIVDLERNDLGRICEYGSVRVDDLRRVESFATVHHTVATVVGRLRAGVSWGEVLRATFPGGSITGAPKIRAMQLLDTLEPHRRGIYTGSLGYLDRSGGWDWNIAIRTALLVGTRLSVGVGGGIVADSVPELELQEVQAKVAGLLRALGEEGECSLISG
ncbi:MAG: aminodeoxychorismate synthase, component I [Candidatus Poribacteria bacterium]|nr:MAG: aminodeoxychorismate synthase, component I [Candidatus Poribacteria bacterium]